MMTLSFYEGAPIGVAADVEEAIALALAADLTGATQLEPGVWPDRSGDWAFCCYRPVDGGSVAIVGAEAE